MKDQTSLKSPFTRPRASHTIGGPTSTDSILAIGRGDGAVHLYDSVGLLLEHKSLSDDGEKIISVEWVKGSSPRPISGTVVASAANEAPSIPPKSLRRKITAHLDDSVAQPVSTSHVADPKVLPTRQFTVHPDKTEEGTVKHTPMRGNVQAPPADNGAYLDLFSPVKQTQTKTEKSNNRRVASPPRSRPRISSQTFVKSPEPDTAAQESKIAKPRNIALFPSTDDTDDTVSPNTLTREIASGRTTAAKPTASAQKTRLTWKPSDRRRSSKSTGLRTLPTQPNNNAKVLADLRKMSTVGTTDQAGGVLSAFRPMQSNSISTKGGQASRNLFHRPTQHIETDLESLDALREYDTARREHKWVEDSEQDDAFGGDIWLTSDSEDDGGRRSRRKKSSAVDRPPARQTSRSRTTSKGTTSTFGNAPTLGSAKVPRVDGSTEEDEAMQTARSHLSPDGTFSPSSNDVRQLFPRSSSLSPRKHKGKRESPVKRSQRQKNRATTAERRTLREMTLNTAHTRQAKSPWEKMRASKASIAPMPQPEASARSIEAVHDSGYGHGTDGTSGGENEELEQHCAVCGPTQARVAGLEGEVARLKGEVLALKAVLRRNGLQVSKGR